MRRPWRPEYELLEAEGVGRVLPLYRKTQVLQLPPGLGTDYTIDMETEVILELLDCILGNWAEFPVDSVVARPGGPEIVPENIQVCLKGGYVRSARANLEDRQRGRCGLDVRRGGGTNSGCCSAQGDPPFQRLDLEATLLPVSRIHGASSSLGQAVSVNSGQAFSPRRAVDCRRPAIRSGDARCHPEGPGAGAARPYLGTPRLAAGPDTAGSQDRSCRIAGRIGEVQ